MNLNAYQQAVARTCATREAGQAETLKLALVGLQDELGEVAGPLKKYLWHGHPLDHAHLQEELGDVLWYLTTLCNALDISLLDVVQANMDKLQKRYPDGFSLERSRCCENEHEQGEQRSQPVKQVYSYQEIGSMVDQGKRVLFTCSPEARVSAVQKQRESDTVTITLNLSIRDTCVGIVEYEYASIADVLDAFDIDDRAEIWEVLDREVELRKGTHQ